MPTHLASEKTGADHAKASPRSVVPAPSAVHSGRDRTTPRYLAAFAPETSDADEPLLVQREEDGSLPAVPRFQLTPPSLLQPRDPNAGLYPNLTNRLRLDPELEAQMLARGRSMLSPPSVLANVAPVAPRLTLPPTSGAGGGTPTPGGVLTPPSPPPIAPPTPGTPATAPQTPPSPDPSVQAQPKIGSGGDVVSAVMALPQVSSMLENVQNQFTSDFSRYWHSASLGEQVTFVSSSVVVGGSMLAPILGFEEPRNFVLPLLNDVVIPVPGLPGYGVEFRFGEHDVMVGAHLDIGRMLPSLWGFGEASFNPIGGPPGSDPNALPPLSRKADDQTTRGQGAHGDPELNHGAISSAIQARAGQGSTLDADVRGHIEPHLGADLSGARIHTDSHADSLSRSVRAHAFTTGRDIFFRAGRFDPETPVGRRLLTHELVHVAQQTHGTTGRGGGSTSLDISDPHDADEREAETIAEHLVAERPSTLGAMPGPAIINAGAAVDKPTAAPSSTSASRLTGPASTIQSRPEQASLGTPSPAPTTPELPTALATPSTSATSVHRQPESATAPAQKTSTSPKPIPAAQASKAAPPPWTDYFDEVVPAVLEAADSHEKVRLEKALWLITQAYGEQSPGVTGRPSGHRNRLFNEQAQVEMEGGKVKSVLPGQESDGVYLYNLKQNESPTRDKTDMKTSPTFGYDTPERSAHHHVDQLQKHWGGAWTALTKEQGSFDEFARSLKTAGYAKAADYDTALIGLQGQVRSQVSAWIRFRLPEMRARIPRIKEYLEFLRSERALAARRLNEEPDPVGSLKAEVESYEGMVRGMEIELADVETRRDRLERFAGVLGVNVK